MKGKKIPGLKSKYLITTNLDDNEEKDIDKALGILSSDFMGSTFNLFDKSKTNQQKIIRDTSKILLTISYVNLFLDVI